MKRGGEESKDEAHETRAKERWMERESHDQMLVGLKRDAHICSISSMIFTQAPPFWRKEEEMKGCEGRMGCCHYK